MAFLADQGKIIKIALAGSFNTIYMALVLRGFAIDRAEPIEMLPAMQCTMKCADFTAFRMRIMDALELCHPNR